MKFKGVFLSIVASATFGVLYFYSQFFKPLNSEQIFGWRILMTLPFLFLMMYFLNNLYLIKDIYLRIKQRPNFIFALLLSSALGCSQLWLFLWGPMNGAGLAVSLGYFLLPLILVLSGFIFFGEKLSRLQKIAVIFAMIGVGHAFWKQGGIAWQTIAVAFGYSAYFLWRKKMKIDHLGGFIWDLMLCLPLCCYLVFMNQGFDIIQNKVILFPILIGLGVLSTIGLGSYILASRYLSLGLFGLLSYLEPVLLALVSLFLGEKIQVDEWLTYIPIWCAVLVLVIEGIVHLLKNSQTHDENI